MAFPNNCDPRIITVDESCGCTLTRANIIAMTAATFEEQGFKEVGMDRVIAQTKEARATGVPQRRLTDLLLSKYAPVKKINLGSARQSVIAPFTLIPQRHRINANYFLVQSGAADPGAGVGVVHAGSWQLVLINDASEFATPLTQLQNYFLVGRYLVVLYKDAVTGVGRTADFKITASVNSDFAGVSRATVTLEPPWTAAGWAALSAANKAIWQPTHGLAINTSNAVSNYEFQCNQDPAVNSMKLLAFWFQTIRKTHCYNDEYLKALNAPLTSEYFKRFKNIPLAEQRKQQDMLAEQAFYNTVFYGTRINEKQTQDTYAQLPQVVDPITGECLYEYKAKTEGIITQLGNCGKVVDFSGGKLDMDLVRATLYTLKRNREIDSGAIVDIDALTDRFTADSILTLMNNYYKLKYGIDIQRFMKIGESIKFGNQVMWNYNTYQFPEENVNLNVITDAYFDDRLAAFPTGDKSMGRELIMIDWSDPVIGLAGTASRATKTFIESEDYRCVITANITHRQLNSQDIAVMVPDPNRHAVFRNFDDTCPSLTVKSCSPS